MDQKSDRHEENSPIYEIEFPNEVNPYLTEDHIIYARRVEQFNNRLQQNLVEIIESNWDGEAEPYAITTTGSDGRLEKGSQSKIELMILHDSSFDPSKLDDSLAGFYKARPKDFWEINELKVLGIDSKPVSGYHGNAKRLFPTRLFDSQLIGGNPDIFLNALAQQEKELISECGKKSIDFLNDRRRDAVQVIKRGFNTFKGKDITHFDLKSGESYYGDPHLSNIGAGSFKFGPLRAIQYRIALDLIKMYRASDKYNKEPPFTLDEIPNNTTQKLLWLEAGNYTTRTHQDIACLADNYCFFLKEYHKSQWSYKHEKKPTVNFNRGEVGDRLARVVNLIEQPIIAEHQ